MSTTEKTFYGIRCDFPDCGENFEGYEYSYWYDPGEGADEARDNGWLTGHDGHDYCPAHVVQSFDDDEQDDDDHYGLRPMPNTVENRLAVVLRRVTDRIESAAREATRRVEDATNNRGWGNRWGQIDEAMLRTFSATCKSFDPTLTSQQIFEMRTGRRP